MKDRRVVVTGLGLVTPIGIDVPTLWSNMLAGKSGISRISAFDPLLYRSQVAGEVRDFNMSKYYSASHLSKARKMDRFVHFASACSRQAIDMAGFDPKKNLERTGVCIGTGIGGLSIHIKNNLLFYEKGNKKVSPYYIPGFIGNIASGFVSMEYGFTGPNMSVQTACATANHAIASAFMIIKTNMADAMLAGGSESAILEIAVAGFDNMRALSTSFNDTPEKASRPFDKRRDGFVISEGGGVLLLEDYESAKRRDADILCEVISVGMSSDAYDMVKPRPDGEGAYKCMKAALDQAGLNPSEINYINAHSTSTPAGDVAEAQAIQRLLGENSSQVYVGSTKSMIGHTLGGAAGIEAAVTAMAVKKNIIPPTINIDELDEEIRLPYINTEPVEKEVNVALSNSFGFGGHNASLCMKKV